MAVVIGDVVNRTTVTNDQFERLQLEGAFGVHTVAIGDRTFVYVAGFRDGGISAFELGDGGSLARVQDVDNDDAPELELLAPANFASAVVGGKTYLYVNGGADDGISTFEVSEFGTLTNKQNIEDNGTLELNGVTGKMSVATLNGASFLVCSGDDDNGISVFRINEADGALVNTVNVTDEGSLKLHDAFDTATANVGGHTFIFVAGKGDAGLSVFELTNDGRTITNTFNVADADQPDLALDGAWGVTTATTADGSTYLIASGAYDGGLSVFLVSDSGTLTNVFNVTDNDARALKGAAGLTTFSLEGEAFIAVSGEGESALGVFHLGSGGVLSNVTSIFDSAEAALNRTYYNAFAAAGGIPYLISAAYDDNGVSTFDVGSGDDVLTGTDQSDLLLGLAGNDLLNGSGGSDRMVGGTGDDTYMAEDASDRVIERADGGTDTVLASISHVLGANVERLTLLGSAAINGSGNELANTLRGNAAQNLLDGGAGDDEIWGGRGKDNLLGGIDDDRIGGGAGNDRLRGGRGDDVLQGDIGRDHLAGEAGSDLFVFIKTRDSGPSAAKRDHIENFAGKDEIDLRRIDADVGEKGNQAFRLDRDGNFAAGEIRVVDTKSGVVLLMNTDQDARAEMSLLLERFDGRIHEADFVF